MSSICLIDTSIFLEILNVPNYNQHTALVLEHYQTYAQSGCTFLLPMATILETGNHIAQNGDGTMRRITALRFVEEVKAAFTGLAPWRTTKYLSKINLTFLEKRKISVFLICSLFPVPCSLSKI